MHEKKTTCLCDSGWQGELCLAQTETVAPREHSHAGWMLLVALLILAVGVVSTVGCLQYVKWKQRASIAYTDLALRADLGSGLIDDIDVQESMEDLQSMDTMQSTQPIIT